MGGGAHEYLLGFCGSSLAGLVEGSLVRRMEGGAGGAAAFPEAALGPFGAELEPFVGDLELFARVAGRLLSTCEGDRVRALGRVPREQKMLKGHLPRVVYHRVY